MAKPQFWLFKTEPNTYSIDDLAQEPNQTTCWEGVRNYQARNMLRDQIKKGDRVLVYHSNAKPPAVAGTAKVVRAGYPDHFACDPSSKYYDAACDANEPRWFMVDIRLQTVFRQPVPLPELRRHQALSKMELLRKGSRLSIQPVRMEEFELICRLGGGEG